ncbi:radical SAM protein [Lachnospiraceae bacterium MD308]|nr:radical SAM protein [Lachnospiraceae bacterium MD308]
MSKVVWNPQMTLIEDTTKYILALNENYFKVPKIYYEYLCKIIGKVQYSDVPKYFAEEDQDIVSKIIEKLKMIGILIEEHQTENVKVQEVTLLLTGKCNFSCLHCCQDAECGGKAQEELTYSEICRIIDKIEKLRIPYILLSGGEPMLRKDFFDIVSYIKKNYSGKLSMITNGSFINQNNLKFIVKNFDSISLSLDGCDKELTLAIRGKDVYDDVLLKADMLKKAGLKYVAISAILPPSREAEEKFDEICKTYNVKGEPRMYSMNGRGGLNAQKIQRIYDAYLEKKGYKKYNPIKYEYLGCLEHCGACRGNLTIDAEGNVYPCNLLQDDCFLMGNIRQDMGVLDNYLESKGAAEIEKVRKLSGMPCEQCDIKNVCWSCLSDVITFANGMISYEERCKYRKQSIYKYYEVEKYGFGNLDNNAMQS